MDVDSSSGLSRRTLIRGAGALGVAAASGIAVGLDPFAPPAMAAPPTSAQGIIDYGKTYLGKTIAQIKAMSPEMAGTPWANYTGEWCAWFVSWISRGLGYGPRFGAPYYDPPNFPEIITGPQVGDFVRIYNGGNPIHVGIVSGVSNGRVTSILDGNRTTVPSWTTTVVRNDGDYHTSVIRRSPLLGSVGYSPIAPRKAQHEMELYAANPPATIPAKYLALNGGLVPGPPIYMLIPAIGIPRITQDQVLVTNWAQSLFGQSGNTAVVQISWGWFDQLFDQHAAIAHSLGA